MYNEKEREKKKAREKRTKLKKKMHAKLAKLKKKDSLARKSNR